MKAIFFIFSLYLLVLPGIACIGEDKCNDKEEAAVQAVNHKDHQDEKDDCGSFCTCSCCVHIISVNFQPAVVIDEKPFQKNKKLATYYSISHPSNYFGNIWQPPRMS